MIIMKLKVYLFRALLIFIALFIPNAILTALYASGTILGGIGTIILYAPFFYFIFGIVLKGKIGPKLPPEPTMKPILSLTRICYIICVPAAIRLFLFTKVVVSVAEQSPPTYQNTVSVPNATALFPNPPKSAHAATASPDKITLLV